MTKRTFPSLAVFLTLVLAASGPALATRSQNTGVPDVITVSSMEVSMQERLTEVVLKGDFPLNYLVYQPERRKVVLEVRDCDAAALQAEFPDNSPEVISMETTTETEPSGMPVTRFAFTLAPEVTHTVTAEGNNLMVRFRGQTGAAAPQPPAQGAASTVALAAAPAQPGLIAFTATGAGTYARQAGIPDSPEARALVGMDTSASGQGKVVLLLDGPVSFSTFEMTDPARLVVDLEGLTNEIPDSSIAVDSSYLHRVRVSQFRQAPDKVARAVFDLSRPASYEVVPTPAGLAINFSKAMLPETSDFDMARSHEEETPAPAESRPQAVVPQAVVAAAVAPVQAETEPEFLEPATIASLDQLMADDYAFFSEKPVATNLEPGVKQAAGLTFESKTIADDRPMYTGRRISLELVDADLKQVFRLFHDISGLNFVLDPSVGGKVTIVLDNVPWDQTLDIILRNNGLDKIFDNNVVRIASTAKLAAEAQERRALKEASRLEVDPITVSRVLSYAKAEELDPIVRRILSSRGQSFYDKRTNTVIVTDIPEKVAAVNTLMDDLDARTPQVMIEARIVETSRQFTRDLGIDWGFLANDQRGAGNSTSIDFDLNLPKVAAASRLGISFGDLGPNGFSLDLALDALETEGRGRILSAPKVVAQNNSTAVIEQGVQIPVVNTTATEINVEFISASLKLEVTPQITAEGTVIMDIKVDNSSPDFVNKIGDTPAINTERASTRVLVEDGGTTVIGGVFLLNEGESESGIPGLRRIPGLGWLFKNKNVTKENRELLIFITPKIQL